MNDTNKYVVYADILSIFRSADALDWKSLRKSSVHRVMYLASVLFGFKFPEKDNIFSKYNFSIEKYVGPFSSDIEKGVNFLSKDEYLIPSGEEEPLYSLGTNAADQIFKEALVQARDEWLKLIVSILSLYGENKIYDFIFRDKEYQDAIKSNKTTGFDIGPENRTIQFLKGFQAAFEETLPQHSENVDATQYLELYFEYVFSKILKREN
ncbi:hypothetical protein [Kordiimonas laminariae]|uniref:hypothetical protein n=1 Tax=Kordiimonas laminariae TaxID=2917717 RepID=UPI001FF27BCF|nr:hypothetical protein [Kordiimonas laminariae]MCK0069407.1 hypothetical protein [Kordiimonas laminariae]